MPVTYSFAPMVHDQSSPNVDCDELHRTAADLHAKAERGMKEATQARGDQTSFVEQVGDVAHQVAEATAVENQIEEDC